MATNKKFKRFNGSIWEEFYFYAYDSDKLGGNAASYYQPASTAITTSNIGSQSVASAAALTTARTISLTGDATGSVSFDGSANVSITVAVADDSHNHIISNIDGLETALAGKSDTTHAHGNITSDGKITTITTPYSGDYLLISDNSDSQIIKKAIAIGTDTNTYLRNDGSWVSPAGATTLQSIKNFSTYTASNGTTAVAVPTTEAVATGNIYALEISTSTVSSYTRQLIFVWLSTGSAGFSFINYYALGNTLTYLYKGEVYHASGTLYIDDVYRHTINDTAAEDHPLDTTSPIYVWNVYKVN